MVFKIDIFKVVLFLFKSIIVIVYGRYSLILLMSMRRLKGDFGVLRGLCVGFVCG